MPRPITPTQFTVLTKASASAARMLPVLYSIMSDAPSVVPGWQDFHPRPMGDTVHYPINLHPYGRRSHTDSRDERPGKVAVNQELGLLAFLHCRRSKIRCGNC